MYLLGTTKGCGLLRGPARAILSRLGSGLTPSRPIYSVPFQNQAERAIHFAKHGHEFGARDELEYERLADQFLFGEMNADTRECIRPNGNDRLRLDYVVVHFGVACIVPALIRTFYRVKGQTITRHDGSAGFFRYECGRMTL